MLDSSFKLNHFLIQNKFPIIVTLIFFLAMSYITFFHHLYFSGQEQDGIYYLLHGREFFDGNLENIEFLEKLRIIKSRIYFTFRFL